MRLPHFALACLLTMTTSPVFAASYDTPQALLTALYADKTVDADTDALTPYHDYFSDHLNGLFKANAAKTPPGEALALDFDPVIAGQDGDATQVKVGKPEIDGSKAKVVVKFKNGEPVTLYYSLVKQADGWKVDDIEDEAGQFPWKVSKIFADAQ